MRTAPKTVTYRPPDLGSMNERLTLQMPVQTQGARGGVETTYSDYATIWARVHYPARSGREGIAAEQEIVITPVEFTIRFREDVKENWRILHRDEYYDIINIRRPYGRFGQMVLVGQKLSSDNG